MWWPWPLGMECWLGGEERERECGGERSERVNIVTVHRNWITTNEWRIQLMVGYGRRLGPVLRKIGSLPLFYCPL